MLIIYNIYAGINAGLHRSHVYENMRRSKKIPPQQSNCVEALIRALRSALLRRAYVVVVL